MLSLQAIAQGNTHQRLIYSKGSYEHIPFHYPDVLSEEDVEELITSVEELTPQEIATVYYSKSRDLVSILTCKEGTIISGDCDHGKGIQFIRTATGWNWNGNPAGRWME